VPDADVVVVVKHAPPQDWTVEVTRRAALVYCPVDFYGSAAAIDADEALLRRCARIVVHCERLRRYFAPYAAVEYLDHHVKFAGPLRQESVQQGYVLWVGVRSNLEALVAWVNANFPARGTAGPHESRGPAAAAPTRRLRLPVGLCGTRRGEEHGTARGGCGGRPGGAGYQG
jgi:hypothetical protein